MNHDPAHEGYKVPREDGLAQPTLKRPSHLSHELRALKPVLVEHHRSSQSDCVLCPSPRETLAPVCELQAYVLVID